MHRATFRAVGGLIDRTLGSADRHMAMGLLNRAIESIPPELQETEYGRMVLDWQSNAQYAKIKLSHVDGKVYHNWHGELKNRKYVERWEILIKNDFRPRSDMRVNELGLLVWSEHADPILLQEICDYFRERNDDQTPEEAMESRKSSDVELTTKAPQPFSNDGAASELANLPSGDQNQDTGEPESLDNSPAEDGNIGMDAEPDNSPPKSEETTSDLPGGCYDEGDSNGDRKASTIFKGKGPVSQHPEPLLPKNAIDEEPVTLSAVDLLTAKRRQPISSSSIEQISIGSGSSSSSEEFEISAQQTPKGPFELPFHRDSSSLGNDLLGMPGLSQELGAAIATSSLAHAAIHQSSSSSMESAQATTIITQSSSDCGTVNGDNTAISIFQTSLEPVIENVIPGLPNFYAGGA